MAKLTVKEELNEDTRHWTDGDSVYVLVRHPQGYIWYLVDVLTGHIKDELWTRKGEATRNVRPLRGSFTVTTEG